MSPKIPFCSDQPSNSSTGRASTLTSPTSDFSPDIAKNFPSSNDTSREEKEQKEEKEEAIYQAPEKIKHSSSSIIGLRVAVNPPSTSKSRNDLVTSASVTDQEEVSPKPRPPPKPRPWSLVGVDRKSGEYTVVEGGGVTPPQPDPGEVEEVEDDDEEEKGGSSEGRRGSLVTNQRGSVRDMIASLNKPEKDGVGGTVGGLLGAGSVRDRIASMNKGDSASDSKPRKGNSLPRNTEGLSAPAKSPGLKAKNSPKSFRKENSDTASDPRILKLDDDFMYEDSGNV